METLRMDRLDIQRLRRLLGETTLLVVDDTPLIRDIVQGMLEPLGLRSILQAGDGEEALKILQGGSVNMVVADWLMPCVNGLDLLRKIRSDERLRDIPFIMITGSPDKKLVAEAMTLDATDFMAKPINGSVLKQKILKALSRKSD